MIQIFYFAYLTQILEIALNAPNNMDNKKGMSWKNAMIDKEQRVPIHGERVQA